MGLFGLVGKLIGTSDEREVAQLQKIVQVINDLEAEYSELSNEQLRLKTDAFRRRLAGGEELDDLLPEAFAAMREATRRTIGMRHFDVQLIGGMILHQGKIAEMKTGEGKTLVATLPLYLNGLELNPEWVERASAEWGDDPAKWEFIPLDGVTVGRGVHLVTVNDYLARRDGGWMGPAFHLLGLTVGLVIPGLAALYDPDYVEEGATLEDTRLAHWRPCTRQEAYLTDATYGTNNEFGFDYLRDNMVLSLDQCSQRELNYAIIDEIDNVLIDEARTPLIISGPSDQPSDLYRLFSDIARRLKRDTHYELEERTRVATLTEEGVSRIESLLPDIKPGEGLYDSKHAHMVAYLDNALHAHAVYKRDKDYIVQDGQVIIVDDFTGRLLHGRRYSEGLHQAIEAKEGLAIQRESLTYGTITIQNYYRMYRRLAGMTGTAATEKEEFHTIYRLDVVVLPTNVEYRAKYGNLTLQRYPASELEDVTFAGVLDGRDGVTVTAYERDDPPEMYFQRLDLQDAIYLDSASKFDAIVEEIEAIHNARRPTLIGTIAVETSEHLSRLLDKRGIPHNVLNAKKHQQEALVIAQAGRPGAVTIATNMAGRGVDILLGGNPEALAARTLRQELESRLPEVLSKAAAESGQENWSISQETLQLTQKLTREYGEYESAKREGGSSLPTFYATQLIADGEVDPKHRTEAVRIARHVLADEWEEAGQLTQQVEGMKMSTLSSLQNIRERFETSRDANDYIIQNISSSYHNLLMTIIRLTLTDEVETAESMLARYPEFPSGILQTIKEIHATCLRDMQEIKSFGGLHVIGTERHEARRIDNQLRGRAGRQGDPGSSRFYLSMEDELMRRFGGERVQNMMRNMGMGDMPLEFGILSKTVESAQSRVEGYNFDLRKHVLEFDDVINKQREVIYGERRRALTERDLGDQVLRMLREEISGQVVSFCADEDPQEWDLKGLHTELRTFVPDLGDAAPRRWRDSSLDEIEEEVFDIAQQAYDNISRTIGSQLYQQVASRELSLSDMRSSIDPIQRLIYSWVAASLPNITDADVATTPLNNLPPDAKESVEQGFADALRVMRDRQVMVRTVDSLWVRYLTDLAILREGIGLRAFGQQNPLVAFQKEGHEMFQMLLNQIQSNIARSLLRTSVTISAPRRQLQTSRPRTPRQAGQPQQTQPASSDKVGRNDPCWCGSGKKYKHCHMVQEMQQRGDSSATRNPPPKSPSRRRRRR